MTYENTNNKSSVILDHLNSLSETETDDGTENKELPHKKRATGHVRRSLNKEDQKKGRKAGITKTRPPYYQSRT